MTVAGIGASRIPVRSTILVLALTAVALPGLSGAQPKVRGAPVAKGEAADLADRIMLHETFTKRIRSKWQAATPTFCFRPTDPVSANWRRPSDSCPSTAGSLFKVQRWTPGNRGAATLEIRETSSNLCLGVSGAFSSFPSPTPTDRIPAVGMDCGDAARLTQISVPGQPTWFYVLLDRPAPPPQPGPGQPSRLCLEAGTNILDGFGYAKHFVVVGTGYNLGQADLGRCQRFQFF